MHTNNAIKLEGVVRTSLYSANHIEVLTFEQTQHHLERTAAGSARRTLHASDVISGSPPSKSSTKSQQLHALIYQEGNRCGA